MIYKDLNNSVAIPVKEIIGVTKILSYGKNAVAIFCKENKEYVLNFDEEEERNNEYDHIIHEMKNYFMIKERLMQIKNDISGK